MFASGVLIVCVAAPPSDHDWKVYVTPPMVCVAAAPIGRWKPTTLAITVPAGVRLAVDRERASPRAWSAR